MEQGPVVTSPRPLAPGNTNTTSESFKLSVNHGERQRRFLKVTREPSAAPVHGSRPDGLLPLGFTRGPSLETICMDPSWATGTGSYSRSLSYPEQLLEGDADVPRAAARAVQPPSLMGKWITKQGLAASCQTQQL